MSCIYASLEAALLLVACLTSGSATHLTWWNAGLLALCDAAYVLIPSGSGYCRIWTASATLSVLVQTTVVLMSLMGCSMIQDTLKEIGPWTYFFGNFVLHYWPTLRVTAIRPKFRERQPLHCDAARIVAIYATIQAPEKVYACSGVPALLSMPLGVAAAIGIERAVLNATFFAPSNGVFDWWVSLRQRGLFTTDYDK